MSISWNNALCFCTQGLRDPLRILGRRICIYAGHTRVLSSPERGRVGCDEREGVYLQPSRCGGPSFYTMILLLHISVATTGNVG